MQENILIKAKKYCDDPIAARRVNCQHGLHARNRGYGVKKGIAGVFSGRQGFRLD
jgi:hypothetical protein